MNCIRVRLARCATAQFPFSRRPLPPPLAARPGPETEPLRTTPPFLSPSLASPFPLLRPSCSKDGERPAPCCHMHITCAGCRWPVRLPQTALWGALAHACKRAAAIRPAGEGKEGRGQEAGDRVPQEAEGGSEGTGKGESQRRWDPRSVGRASPARFDGPACICAAPPCTFFLGSALPKKAYKHTIGGLQRVQCTA